MIVETGGRRISVLFNTPPICPAGVRVLHGEVAAPRHRGDPEELRIVVELLRAHGGFRVRALLGGVFRGLPTRDRLVLATHFAPEPWALDRPRDVPSDLGGPLACGLPADFAETAHRDLLSSLGAAGVPAGVFGMDLAAHDPVDTSEYAVRLTADVLAVALAARLSGRDVEQRVLELVIAW